MQRVIVQADRNARMQPDQILTYNVRNSERSTGADVVLRHGALVGRAVADRRLQLLSFGPDLGLGQARLYQRRRDRARWSASPAQLAAGFGYEWTGQSLQEKLSGSQAPFLLMLSVCWCFSFSPRFTKAGPFRWRFC